jgi:hypothetical protein
MNWDDVGDTVSGRLWIGFSGRLGSGEAKSW